MPVLLILGAAVLLAGIILFFIWFAHILSVLKAVMPLAFIIGGAVAAYLGWEEMRDQKGPVIDFSNPDEANRYKTEAKAYQEEIDGLKSTDPEPVSATYTGGLDKPGAEAANENGAVLAEPESPAENSGSDAAKTPADAD